MKKHWKIIAFSFVALALAASGTYPHFGLAEKSEQTQQSEKGNAVQTDQSDVKASDKKAVTVAASSANTSSSLYPITAVHKIAVNDKYELYIDDATANIRIVNKEKGTQWLGSPQVDRKTLPTEKKYMDSPVHIKYTEGVDITSVYSLKDKETTFKIKPTEDGAIVSFNFGKLNIAFDVVYRIRQDGLELTVPYNSIQENGAAKLVSVELLPFMNAALEKDEGAIFLPDGSGALMQFNLNHPAYLKGYSEPIYGPDPTFVTQNHDQIEQLWRHVKPPSEYVALPVFGLYRNKTGFLGIVTQGEFDAKINGTPAGIRNIAYYRTSVEFVYRKQDVIFIGSSGKIPYYQGNKISGDRKVRYVMLQGEEANYVGMAQTYRKYLIKEAGVKPAPGLSAKLNLRLMNGIKRDEIIGSTFVSMTSFDQAKTIIDTYAAKGIRNLELTLEGWSNDGLYGNQPEHFPVDKHLGGSKGLKALATYAEGKGISLYLSANYSRAIEESDGFSKNKDAIRGIDREAMPSFNYYVADGWNKVKEKYYFLKPDRMFDSHIQKELDDFGQLGVSGVSLAYMGNTLYSDQDIHHVFERSQTADVWVKSLDAFKKELGKTAVDYGFGYTLGHVDRIDNAPLDSSHFIYTDRAVPFYQIVVHGLVPYTAKPGNLRDDAQIEFLRQLEYGALPSFELTYEQTSKLQRTRGDDLFSSAYTDWLTPSTEEYQALSSFYEGIADQSIVNHEQLGPNVYRTTYGNGASISVNYDTQPISVDGQSIKGLGYVWKKGGSQ